MRVGDLLVGLAADQPHVRSALRHALKGYIVDEVVEPNYTVHVAEDPSDFHRIAWGGCVVVRTRDPRRLMTALARHIGGHGGLKPGEVRTDALSVVRDGMAWLLPAVLRRRIARYERLLGQRGFQVDYGPWTDIDVATGELVIAPPLIAAAVLEEVFELGPSSRTAEPSVSEGRYAISRWVFEGLGSDGYSWARVESVVLALSSLPEPARDCPSIVSDLAAMFERVDVRMLQVEPPNAFVRALAEKR